jgi:hypothetical protein
MNDNIIPFRRPRKNPENPNPKPRGPMPGWLPFAILILAGIAIYGVQQTGLFG